jgi:hypothetical protein
MTLTAKLVRFSNGRLVPSGDVDLAEIDTRYRHNEPLTLYDIWCLGPTPYYVVSVSSRQVAGLPQVADSYANYVSPEELPAVVLQGGKPICYIPRVMKGENENVSCNDH